PARRDLRPGAGSARALGRRDGRPAVRDLGRDRGHLPDLVERHAVVAPGALRRDEPFADVLQDELRLALERVSEAAAARALEHDLVALAKRHVRELRGADRAEGIAERPERRLAAAADEDRGGAPGPAAEQAPG